MNRHRKILFSMGCLWGLTTAVAVGVAIYQASLARQASKEVTLLRGLLEEWELQALMQAPDATKALTHDAAVVPEKASAPDARDAEVQALMQRIAQLERQAERREEDREARPPAWSERLRQWQTRMRERDPDSYAQRQVEMRERLQALSDMAQDRLDFITQISVDGLAPEYLENHLELIQRMVFFNDALQQISENPESMESLALIPQVFANLRGLDEMLALQRTVLLDDLASDMGYEGEDADQFVESIARITEVTTLPPPSFFRQGSGAMDGGGGPPVLVLP